jgi:hypothetical protein
MDPVVIEETTLNTTHYNFVEFQPAPGHLIEVLCFQSGHFPINTFDIFRGISDEDERSNIAILLTEPVTKVSVVNGTITESEAATSDDGIVMVHEDEYNNIYWKYHTPAMPPPRRQKKAASVTIEKPTTPKQVKQPVTESPVSVISPFGGKTKKRKSRKKLKRKSTKVRIGKRLP